MVGAPVGGAMLAGRAVGGGAEAALSGDPCGAPCGAAIGAPIGGAGGAGGAACAGDPMGGADGIPLGIGADGEEPSTE
jgi:hypothetical protein